MYYYYYYDYYYYYYYYWFICREAIGSAEKIIVGFECASGSGYQLRKMGKVFEIVRLDTPSSAFTCSVPPTNPIFDFRESCCLFGSSALGRAFGAYVVFPLFNVSFICVFQVWLLVIGLTGG